MFLMAIVLAGRGEDVEHNAARVESASAVREVGRDRVGVPWPQQPGFVTERQFQLAFEHDPELLVGMLVAGNFPVRLDRDPVGHELATGQGLHDEFWNRRKAWRLIFAGPGRRERY